MLRKLISPVQGWLLARNQCVGCGTPLNLGHVTQNRNKQTKVKCVCGRVFIKERDGHYRRALMVEV